MRKYIAIGLLFCCLLQGCSQLDILPGTDVTGVGDGQESLLEKPILDYDVPVSTPNIAVNQMGYLTNHKKVAVFKGKELPEVFSVCDKETKRVVYSGIVEQGNKESTGALQIGYGDFSDVVQAGEYYIEAPVLGQSYSFFVGKDLYNSVFEEACRQYYYNRCGITLTEEYAGEHMRSACHAQKAVLREDISVTLDVSGGWHQDETGGKDVKSACTVAAMLLLSYDIYEGAFSDEAGIPESGNGIPDILDEVKFETEWLLKMQNATTGGVYSALTAYERTAGNYPVAPSIYVEPESLEATAAYCALLAKFSYIFQAYDPEYATMCLKAADRAWQHLESHQEEGEKLNHIRFWAATELYRASGYQKYHAAILEYLKADSYKDYYMEEAMLGCITYISTQKSVNMEQCENIIKYMMQSAEEIVWNAKQSAYLAAGNEEQTNQKELLQQMFVLNIVNYVITNLEYETVIYDHIHYFMGRNAGGISYLDDVGVNNYKNIDINMGIMKQIDLDSKLVFILSKTIADGYS